MTSVVAATCALVATAAPASATTFSNPATITMPDPNCTDPDPAVPYPSNIAVSGLTGTVSDVNVTLTGVTHPFEGDLEFLLVGPGGGAQNLTLLSDAGTGALSNATLTFDDSAASQPPQNVAWPAGTYKPVNYTELTGADTFPAPAPAPSANTTLATAFNGIAPNGTWSLYVIDDACPDAGSIAGGWSIDITTSAGAVTSTSLTSSLNPSRTGQNVTFTATVTSGGNPVTTGTVTFTEGATTLAANVALNGSGQASFAKSNFAEGNHTVTATYNGVLAFATSNGSLDQRVDNDTTATGNTYCNAGAITINDNGPATPYPSNIFVTGAGANLGKVTVTLKNVTHGFDGDVEALLVGPTGLNLEVVSDAGTAGVSNVTVNLDDAAASLLPAAGSWAAPNSTITVKPTNYNELTPDSFPPPAPAPSAATMLSTFDGTNPNGTWSLYVKDDGAPDTGSIAGGWCVNLTAGQLTPTITTSAITPVTIGSPVSDTATVTGAASPAPTGFVTFAAFGPGNPTCTGAAAFNSGAQPLAGGPPPTAGSGNFTPTAVGSYNWVAVYSGDANYPSMTSPCGAANETSVVTKASPSISTQASAGGTIGTSVTDTATVSGGSSPSGTVTFRLFSDAGCATQVFTSSNALTAGTATSGSFSLAAPGVYRWTAVYNGDTDNNTATSACNAPNEAVTIAKAVPTIATHASAGNILGAPVTDTATVGGGLSPTGTVTFRLFSDNTCATQVFTSANALSGGTATSGSFTPGAAGTYYWTAVYNGDANNDPATSPCNAPNESVVITPFQAPPPTQTITGDFSGPVTVNAGQSVLITGARVTGPVTVNPGGALTVVGSQITRGITANAPSFFSLCGTQVAGPAPSPTTALTVTNAPVPIRVGDPASGCAGNRFAGQVVLTGNLAVTFGANTVSQGATINANGGGTTVVKANTLFGTLACADNNPPPTNAGQVNSAGAKTGQCAAL